MSDTNPYEPMPYVKIQHPEWSKTAVIYQINPVEWQMGHDNDSCLE